MLVTLLVTAGCVAACFFVHLATLQRLAHRVNRAGPPMRHPLMVVLLTLFAAHLFEVLLYALALSVLDWAEYGSLTGAVVGGPGWFVDHFYFSIASYTTLGIGDIVPQGDIRLMAGIEALNGLVLVAWSASFTYLVMERLWGTSGRGATPEPQASAHDTTPTIR